MATSNPAVGLTIDAAGHPTNYFDLGEGEPLILLHGSGPGVSTYWNWRDVMGPLSEHFRVLAPDMAGFGYTDVRPDGDYNIKVWVRHLFGFMDALGLRSATLVGNSFGGGLSLAATMKDPSRIDRLILMGTPAGEFPQTDGLASGLHYVPSLENMRASLEMLPFDPAVVTDDLVQARHEASARPGAQEAYRRLMPEPKGPGTMVRGVPETAIRQMDPPALVLHGREDRAIPVTVGFDLFRWLPDAEAHFFGHVGHWVQAERPEAFVELIVSFVQRHPVREAATTNAS
jgi:2-hydroxy-6-oxo-octa-2,4-dienoate hydrolase